jgi:hypothetical protein
MMVWAGTAGGRRYGVEPAASPCPMLVRWCASLPVSVSVLVGVAVLVWLAAAWLTGTVHEATTAQVMPVAQTAPAAAPDGTDDGSGGGTAAPKPTGSTRPTASDKSNTGTASNNGGAKRPAAQNQGTDNNGGGGTTARPAAHQQPQPTDRNGAPAPPPRQPREGDNGANNGGTVAAPPGHPQPRPEAQQQPGTALPAPPSARPPRPEDSAASADDGSRGGSVPSWMRMYTDSQSGGVSGGGRPDKPGSPCGQPSCGDQPPAAPAPGPPTPGSAPNAGAAGGGTPGGTGKAQGQSGTVGDDPPTVLSALRKMQQDQQPGGLVPKNKAPRSGTDPPDPGGAAPQPNLPIGAKPVQPGSQPETGYRRVTVDGRPLDMPESSFNPEKTGNWDSPVRPINGKEMVGTCESGSVSCVAHSMDGSGQNIPFERADPNVSVPSAMDILMANRDMGQHLGEDIDTPKAGALQQDRADKEAAARRVQTAADGAVELALLSPWGRATRAVTGAVKGAREVASAGWNGLKRFFSKGASEAGEAGAAGAAPKPAPRPGEPAAPEAPTPGQAKTPPQPNKPEPPQWPDGPKPPPTNLTKPPDAGQGGAANTGRSPRTGGPGTPHIDDLGRFSHRPGQIASDTGYSVRQIKDAIHKVKRDMPRSGPVRNPDVSVNTTSGNVYVKLPDGSRSEDPIGNIFDHLPESPR